jgi:hypothetical protein
MFSSEIDLGEGWYPEENDGSHAFRWMRKESRFLVPNLQIPGKKYLLITAACHSYAESKRVILELYINHKKRGERRIRGSFCSYAFPFYETGNLCFDLKLNATYPVPGDQRELGIMLRRLEFEETPSSEDYKQNSLQNSREALQGFPGKKNQVILKTG